MKTEPALRKGFDYIGVSVVMMCHDGNGRFVLMKRGANARDEHGKWDPGSGALEFGDTVDQRIRTEIKEELCTDVFEYEFLGYRDVHREYNGQSTQWIGLDFLVRVDPEKVKIGEPHKFTDIGWFTINTLPPASELHSQFPLFLEKYADQLRTI